MSGLPETRTKQIKEYEDFLIAQEKKKEQKLYSDLRYVTRKPIHYFDIEDYTPTEGQIKRGIKKKRGRKPKNKK